MTGTLGLFSLVDLFQLLAASRRTGRLSVRHPTGPVRLYFDHGQLRHAEFGDLEGVAAIDALFADERGTFSFVAGLPVPRTTVTTSTEALVLDAMRRLDEARRTDDVPPPFVGRDAVPYGSDGDSERRLLDEFERRVMTAVNGHWTVARIARELGVEEQRACSAVGRMVQVGFLRLRSRRTRTARLVVRLAPGSVPEGMVAVDAGIVRAWREVVGRADEVAIRRPDGVALALPMQAVEGVGAYLWVPRANLVRLGLRVADTVLARPYDGDRGQD